MKPFVRENLNAPFGVDLHDHTEEHFRREFGKNNGDLKHVFGNGQIC